MSSKESILLYSMALLATSFYYLVGYIKEFNHLELHQRPLISKDIMIL